ncbi:MAG: hypothetical protein HC828_12955 [Blastochloris sp.]|nr:hypothetical protein [Blastochloris sp.]
MARGAWRMKRATKDGEQKDDVCSTHLGTLVNLNQRCKPMNMAEYSESRASAQIGHVFHKHQTATVYTKGNLQIFY